MMPHSTKPTSGLNALPILWWRSVFDMQSVFHENMRKMIPPFVSSAIKEEEKECFVELHDAYQQLFLETLAQMINPTKNLSDADIVHDAIARESRLRKHRPAAV